LPRADYGVRLKELRRRHRDFVPPAASADFEARSSSTAAVDNFVDNWAALCRCFNTGAMPVRLLKN
jgi:hypothetical protein